MKNYTVEFYRNVVNDFCWRLKASNGKTVADGGEGYKTLASAKKSFLAICKRIMAAKVKEVVLCGLALCMLAVPVQAQDESDTPVIEVAPLGLANPENVPTIFNAVFGELAKHVTVAGTFTVPIRSSAWNKNPDFYPSFTTIYELWQPTVGNPELEGEMQVQFGIGPMFTFTPGLPDRDGVEKDDWAVGGGLTASLVKLSRLQVVTDNSVSTKLVPRLIVKALLGIEVGVSNLDDTEGRVILGFGLPLD